MAFHVCSFSQQVLYSLDALSETHEPYSRLIDPFAPSAPFLYPLKTENRKVIGKRMG